MARYDDLAPVLTEVTRTWKRLSAADVERLRLRHPGIPEEYLNFLSRFGYGRSDFPAFRFYSGLVPARESFPGATTPVSSLRMFGDDFQGYVLGFDEEWRVVEVDSVDAQPELVALAFEAFVRGFYDSDSNSNP